MKARASQKFQWKLEAEREQAIRSLRRSGNQARTLGVDSPQDSADPSAASLSTECLFQQNSLRRGLLRMIESALQRIREGTFGICAACGDDIQLPRLEAVPWAVYCLRCQEMLEQKKEPEETMQWKRAG